MTWFSDTISSATTNSRPVSRIGISSRWPRAHRHNNSISPAVVHRVPANTPGGTTAMPTFIPSHVVPQTKHNTANNARWRAAIAIAGCAVTRASDVLCRPTPPLSEPAEPERHRIDNRRITRDEIRSQPSRPGPNAEAVPGKTRGQKEPRHRRHFADHRHRVWRDVDHPAPAFRHLHPRKRRERARQYGT